MKPCSKCLCEDYAVEYFGVDREHISWWDPYNRELEAPLGHEWAQKRFKYENQTWTVTLWRCRGCSLLKNEIITEDIDEDNERGEPKADQVSG